MCRRDLDECQGLVGAMVLWDLLIVYLDAEVLGCGWWICSGKWETRYCRG